MYIITQFIKKINQNLKSPIFIIISTILTVLTMGFCITIYIKQDRFEGIEYIQGTKGDNIDKKTIFSGKSSRSKYYYYLGCGGQSIKKQNIIYYSSETEAEMAGKVLHPKCK